MESDLQKRLEREIGKQRQQPKPAPGGKIIIRHVRTERVRLHERVDEGEYCEDFDDFEDFEDMH